MADLFSCYTKLISRTNLQVTYMYMYVYTVCIYVHMDIMKVGIAVSYSNLP